MKRPILSLPVPLLFFIFLMVLPVFLLALVAVLSLSPGAATEKALGLSLPVTLAIYYLILICSVVNVVVYRFKSPGDTEPKYISYMDMKYQLPVWHGHDTPVTLNLGGCIIASLLSLYFALSLPIIPVLLCILAVSVGVFASSGTVRSVGVVMPALIPPLLAIATSFIALSLYQGNLEGIGPMAFVAGTLGTLAGAYLLGYRRIKKAGPAVVSAGGAGTFEAIFLTGVLAAIFAAIL